jgi:hypothetical protein
MARNITPAPAFKPQREEFAYSMPSSRNLLSIQLSAIIYKFFATALARFLLKLVAAQVLGIAPSSIRKHKYALKHPAEQDTTFIITQRNN